MYSEIGTDQKMEAGNIFFLLYPLYPLLTGLKIVSLKWFPLSTRELWGHNTNIPEIGIVFPEHLIF